MDAGMHQQPGVPQMYQNAFPSTVPMDAGGLSAPAAEASRAQAMEGLEVCPLIPAIGCQRCILQQDAMQQNPGLLHCMTRRWWLEQCLPDIHHTAS